MRKAMIFSAVTAALLTGCWDFTTGFDEYRYKILEISDPSFRELLLAEYDSNGDGQLSWYEAACVKSLDCNNADGARTPIADIGEIGYFPNVTTLYMAGNDLSGRIDLTRLKSVTRIDFSSNSASSPGRIKLIMLDAGRKDNMASIVVDEGTEVDYFPEDLTIINFTDEAFKGRLVSQFDTDKDREVSVKEAEKAKTTLYNGAQKVVIDCDNSTGAYAAITAVSEIKYFRYAQVLRFAGNNISGAIDLTKLKKLEEIDFSSNSSETPGQITTITLDVSLEGKVAVTKDEETVIAYK